MCSLLYEQLTKDTQNKVLRSRYTRLRTRRIIIRFLLAGSAGITLLLLVIFCGCMRSSGPTAPVVPAIIVEFSEKAVPEALPMPPIPILAYHRINDDVEKYNGMAISPAHFRRQMKYLVENNYSPITLDQWYNAVQYNTVLPEKPVIITFDDAWKSQYKNALPILKEFNIPATFFVYTAVVGNQTTMSWEQLKELVKRNHTIGSHSAMHGKMTKKFKFENDAKYAARLLREVDGAKKKLEEGIGTPIRHFCYPYGFYNTNVIAYLRKAQFRTAVTVNPMMNTFQTPLYSMGRLIVGPATSTRALREYLESRELPLKALLPGDGIIRNSETIKLKAMLEQSFSDSLCRVKVKWNWNWKACDWDPATGMITCTFKKPLKPGIYSAQIHAWDTSSNHYIYAWQFQQEKTEPIIAGLRSKSDTITLSSHRRQQ
jgi:peptidoglycan/xylan/chitin deacetylase (PgdA/CDA1 family)